MTGTGAQGLTVVVLAMLVVVNAPGAAQRALPVTLQDLTAPKEHLPDGCSLKILDPGSMQPPGVTTNPWTGTDRRFLAEIRQRLDPLRLPDGPPLTRGEESSLVLEYANGIEEGYAATYAQQSGARNILVWALRFAVAPSLEFPRTGSAANVPNVMRIEMGSIRGVMYGDGGQCSQAIAAYLKSLGK